MRLLEIGLAERAGRQQADARIARARRSPPGPCAAHRRTAPAARRSWRCRGWDRRARGPAGSPARSRRRTGPACGRPAPTSDRPGRGQVGGVELQVASARRRHAAQRPHEVGAAGQDGGGQRSFGHQRAVAVDVPAAALPSGWRAASRRRRCCAHSLRPRISGSGLSGQAPLVLLAIDAVGDAGVADVPRGQGEAASDLPGRIVREVAQEMQPVVPGPPACVEQFVRDTARGR